MSNYYLFDPSTSAKRTVGKPDPIVAFDEIAERSVFTSDVRILTPIQVDASYPALSSRKSVLDEKPSMFRSPRNPLARVALAVMSNLIVSTSEFTRLEPTACLAYLAKPASRRKGMSLAEARLLAREISDRAERRRREYLEEESERERLILAAAYDL